MRWRLSAALWAGLSAASALAQPGSINDLYIISDAANEVYQFERNGTYVPGAYPGIAMPQVFSNQSQVGGIGAYIGAFGGPNNNFFIGGFGGVTEIDGNSGAFVRTYGGASRRPGVAIGPDGDLMTSGPSGVDVWDTATGGYVRTIPSGTGDQMMARRGNDVYIGVWNNAGAGIEIRDYYSGSTTGTTIPIPFGPHEIEFGPDGALYATSLYEFSAAMTGVWRYDFGTTTWSPFALASAAGGSGVYTNGPHCFAFDPINGELLTAFADGQIHRWNGATGAYINQFGFVPTKLTDILFKPVPEPTTMLTLGLGVLIVARRRRR